MRISLILLVFFFIGCKHFGLVFRAPSTIKAFIEGEIRGVDVYCEKVINLGQPSWELMCKVSDEININYRSKTIDGTHTKLELAINKTKAGERKTIASPMMIVKKGKPTALSAIAANFNISIKTEEMP